MNCIRCELYGDGLSELQSVVLSEYADARFGAEGNALSTTLSENSRKIEHWTWAPE